MRSDDGTVLVDWTVTSREAGGGEVAVVALVDRKPDGKPVLGTLGPGHGTVAGGESATVAAAVLWTGQDKPEERKRHVQLPADC
jgi:hypothetical protein